MERETFEEMFEKKIKALELARFCKFKMIQSQKSLHHLLGKLQIIIKSIQEIRDSSDNKTKDDMQSLLDILKLNPADIYFKPKNKSFYLPKYKDYEWTIIVWKKDSGISQYDSTS